VLGHEVKFLAASDQRGSQLRVLAAVGDVPLARGHDLERLVALLEELHGVRDDLGLALKDASLAEHFNDALLSGEHGLASQLGIGVAPRLRVDSGRGFGEDATVPTQDGARGQLQFAPPDHVGDVAEGANHGDARALVRGGKTVSNDGHFHAEQGRAHVLAEEWLVALIVGVRDESDAGRKEFGPRGLDVDRLVGTGGLFEVSGRLKGETVVGARAFAVLKLCLSHGRAERHVPQRRCLRLIGLPARERAQEGLLGDGLRVGFDGSVRPRPVHGQAQVAPQHLELLLVLGGQALAQFDEVAARNRRLVGRLDGLALATQVGWLEVVRVGKCGVAAHAVVVLHAALGGQSVVVPAHRVEHLAPAHPLVASDDVGVRVGKHVTHVKRAGDGGRGSVDRVDLVPRLGAVKLVDPVRRPRVVPAVFETVHCGLFWDARSHVGHSFRRRPRCRTWWRRTRGLPEVVARVGRDRGRRSP